MLPRDVNSRIEKLLVKQKQAAYHDDGPATTDPHKRVVIQGQSSTINLPSQLTVVAKKHQKTRRKGPWATSSEALRKRAVNRMDVGMRAVIRAVRGANVGRAGIGASRASPASPRFPRRRYAGSGSFASTTSQAAGSLVEK